jgi:transposase
LRQRHKQAPQSAEETVGVIRRATRRHFSAEAKIRIVLEGLRGEVSIAGAARSRVREADGASWR